MRIIRVASSGKGYGGNIYESYIDKIYEHSDTYEVVRFQFKFQGFMRIVEIPRYLYFCWRLSRNHDYFLIRNFNTAFFPLARRKQGCTLVYHIDEKGSGPLLALFQKFLEKAFFLQLRKSDNLVVIAQFWQNYFRKKGFVRSFLIHCPFEIEKYHVSDEQVQDFRTRHELLDKPIIYLGNPQTKKGFLHSLHASQNLDAFLVSTGEGEHQSMVRHLKLSFQDYIILLKASAVVLTMSIFKEGWCRVAHEALLLDTPVVGSGQGGMNEIFKNGGGILCENLAEFPGLIQNAIEKKDGGAHDLGYLRSFTVSRFENEFKEMLARLIYEANNRGIN